jgi:rubrerythrin
MQKMRIKTTTDEGVSTTEKGTVDMQSVRDKVSHGPRYYDCFWCGESWEREKGFRFCPRCGVEIIW